MVCTGHFHTLATSIFSILTVVSFARTVPSSTNHVDTVFIGPRHARDDLVPDNTWDNTCPSPPSNNTGDCDAFSAPNPPSPTLCKRGACFSAQANTDRVSIPALSRARAKWLWNEAGITGSALEALMHTYVSRRVSRLDETSSPQQRNFEQNYRKANPNEPTNAHWIHWSPEFPTYWAQTNYPSIDFQQGWKVINYFSIPSDKPPKTHLPTVDIVGNAEIGMLVSTRTYANCDGNTPADRAYSSTITWNAWKQIATDRARHLKYQVRLDVQNRDSNHIAAIAHELYPQNVNHRGESLEPLFPQQPARTGHGRWTPDDEAWPYLLAMPNVKPIVNMVVDYNTEMESSWIVAIHTFPEVLAYTYDDIFAGTRLRPGYIVVEFGSEAQPLSPAPASEMGTIQTE